MGRALGGGKAGHGGRCVGRGSRHRGRQILAGVYGKYLDRIAGKTGSAQVGTTSIDIENTSWFVSYTPREGEAELVIVICVPSGYAGVWSVSAAEEIYTYYFNKQDSAAPETLVDIGGIAP